MTKPVECTRTLFLVGLVSVGFILAGGGLVGATSDSPGSEATDESLELSTDSPTTFVIGDRNPFSVGPEPVAQADPPGQTDTPTNGSAGQGSNQTTASDNRTTGAPQGQTNSSESQTQDANKTVQGADTASSGPDQQSTGGDADHTGADSSPSENNATTDSSSKNDTTSPSANNGTGDSPTGNSASDSSNRNGNSHSPSSTDTTSNNADRGATQATDSPSSNSNGNGQSSGNGGGPPAETGSSTNPTGDSPDAASNTSSSSDRGPPEWVDSPGGPTNESPRGPPGGAAGLPNGTSHTVSVGGENVTITVSQGPPETTPGSRVVAHVANATPNGSVPVTLPQSAANASVRTEQLSVDVNNRQNFSLGVTTRSQRNPNRTPEFTPSEAAEGIGYISVDHTVPDSEIDTVTFTFAVDSETISPGEREDITLYRHHNGSWNEVATEYVDRNESAYVFEATAPGLSEFTVGKKVPAFEIQEANLLAEVQTTADPVDVRVRITNEGGADGVYTARLLLDQEEQAREKLSIAAGGTRQTSFEENVEEPGNYTVVVNNYTIGTLDVDPAASETVTAEDSVSPTGIASTRSDQEPAASVTDDSGPDSVTPTQMPGFGILAGTFGLVVAVLSVRRRAE